MNGEPDEPELPQLGEARGFFSDASAIVADLRKLIADFRAAGELRGDLTITPQDGKIKIDWRVEMPGK